MSTPGSTHATRCVGVDLEHPVQLRGDDHDRVVDRRRAAGEPGAAPPRDERPAVARGDAHRGGDLVAPSAGSTPPRRAPASTPASRAYSASSSGSARARSGPSADAEVGEERARRRRCSRRLPTASRTLATDGQQRRRATERSAMARRRRASGSRSTTRTKRTHAGRSTSRSSRRRGSASSAAAARACSTEPAPELVAGLLLLRRALLRQEGPRPRREGRRGAQRRRVAVRASAAARRASTRRSARTTTARTEWRTRLVDDACIFLNRPGFAAGPGCALHLHAMQHRRALQRAQARGVLAAPAAPRSTTSRTTAP